MSAVRRPTPAFLTALFLSISSFPLAAQNSQTEAALAVRAAVASEMQADQADKSIWTYRDHDDVPGKDATYLTVETRQGSLRRMIELSGQPLSPAATEAETQRIERYVHDSSAQAKARKNGAHDDAQAAEMLKMLPEAFIWSIVSQTPELTTLSFKPNPKFNPPNMQARVMGIMGGEMVIVRNGNRIRTLRGALTEDVLIGFGIFAKLYKGGTFDVVGAQSSSSELGAAPAAYVGRMRATSSTGETCVNNGGLGAGGPASALPPCYHLYLKDVENRTGLPYFTAAIPGSGSTAGVPGSLGLTELNGGFWVEMTDPIQVVRPVAGAPIDGSPGTPKFIDVTVTSSGVVWQDLAGGTVGVIDSNERSSATFTTGRGHVIVGPVYGPI